MSFLNKLVKGSMEMIKKITDTELFERIANALEYKAILLEPEHLGKVIKVLFYGGTKLLGSVKSVDTPKALTFRKADGTFICGAKVSFKKNPDNPDDISSGSWSYIWTFDEDDIRDATEIIVDTKMTVMEFFKAAGRTLFHMNFPDDSVANSIFNTIFELLGRYLDDNASADEVFTLTMPGIMEASSEVKDGKIIKTIVPDGEIKILIKDDDAYQEE